jgi:4-amino-4-deoxy-L-arabinose transferase-like glycosyltransferase
MKIEESSKKNFLLNIALIATLSISFFVRVYQLENYPLQINNDELSNIYDGYSIAETGADRWGNKYPIILRGFGRGDYRPPMNAWICAASIKIFGYSIFAGRFPSALIGCISLFLLYIIAKKIGGILFGFITLLLTGLSPWHILFSRMAHEATTLPSFFMLLAVYFWIKVKEEAYRIKYLVLLGFSIGLATNICQSAKLIFFLLAIITTIEVLRNTFPDVKKVIFFALSVLIGALPQIIAAVTLPEHFFSRANETLIKFSFSFEYLQNFLSNFSSNLSPHYLFFSFGEYNNLTVGRLLTVEAIFFYLGLFIWFKIFKKSKIFIPVYIYILLVITLLPSALTMDQPHALRASCSTVLFPMFSAAGIVFIYRKIIKESVQKTFLAMIFILILSNAYLFIYKYVNNWELKNAGQQNMLVQFCNELNKYPPSYSKIYIEDFGNQPYIYIASYCHMTPGEFQSATKKIQYGVWDHFNQLGKYYFLSRADIDTITNSTAEKRLFLLQSKNSNYTLLDSINAAGKEIYFYKN